MEKGDGQELECNLQKVGRRLENSDKESAAVTWWPRESSQLLGLFLSTKEEIGGH